MLKDKWAWDMSDHICAFLQRHRKGGDVIVSGREDEIEGTFAFADRYVEKDYEFNALWHEERKEADTLIERWQDILNKKETRTHK